MKTIQKLCAKVLSLPLLLLILAYCKEPDETPAIYYLGQHWEFCQSGSEEWRPASVPGCVHTDLLMHGLIPDPFFGDNEKAVQWIEGVSWEYRTKFDLERDLASYDHIEIVFEGLDTYAEIILNDSFLLQTDNMFREWRVDCKHLLKHKENNLLIRFSSPAEMDSLKSSALPYQLPDSRSFTRKAPFQYGWDWAPRLVTAGIWKQAYLKGWNTLDIRDVFIEQKEVTSEKASFTLLLEYAAGKNGTMEVTVTDEKTSLVIKNVKQDFTKGEHVLMTTFEIQDPKLWWTNGLGDAHLYHLSIGVSAGNSKEIIKRKVGIRTIELVQEPDSVGSSFVFKLNGIPVFMKGANYVPQDHFPSRVPDEKYVRIIEAAVNANMNMIRVWGGGIYEKDLFYDLCDQSGILVWQDFMFACNMYPGDDAFLENVGQEAAQQVKRLRKHPSLAIWCGNNEVDEGWHNWGWQRTLGHSPQDSAEIWNNYLKIFKDLLPGIILAHSPAIPYVPTSPKTGWGREEALYSGSMHYWGVWWGEEPFEIYESKVGRFMSEYGFQGFPGIQTINAILPEEDKHLRSAALLNHQKHPRGMELIQSYMERDYKVPVDFEHYAYVSHLVQAYGIKKAIEAHRRAKPWCMGTLFWQLNDCWPVISWSAIDYKQYQKALYYFVREAYHAFLISFEASSDLVDIHVVSDQNNPVHAALEVEIMDFYGNRKWSEISKVTIQPNTSNLYQSVKPGNLSQCEHLLAARLTSGDSVLASAIHYFARPKELNLPKFEIKWQIKPVNDGISMVLSTDALVKNIFLSSTKDCVFEENYFDLLPGVPKVVKIKNCRNINEFENNLTIISLRETINE